jgi:hypothetical protein
MRVRNNERISSSAAWSSAYVLMNDILDKWNDDTRLMRDESEGQFDWILPRSIETVNWCVFLS